VRRAGVFVAVGAAGVTAVVLAALRVGERAGALSDWQALALGVVQGFTELLPISSSGHLILLPWVANWHYLETHESFNKTFDVALHVGTLVAVVAYFWSDVRRILAAWFRSVWHRSIQTTDERLAWCVFWATIPAAIAGALGESFIERKLGQPWQIAILMAVFAIILYIADRSAQQRKIEDLGYLRAIVVGAAQVIALMPGVSRSGISITAGRFLRLDRDSAARFSFLLLIPVVFGAAVYKGMKDVVFGTLPPGSGGPFIVGTLAAAATGMVAIWALLGYLRRNDYTIFVIYRLALAVAILILIATGARAKTF
jgi:undecaprenyl-diphosphatase